MSDISAAHCEWRQLCQIALLETDPAKLLVRIADARSVILDRIEDGHSKSNDEPPHYETHWLRWIVCAE